MENKYRLKALGINFVISQEEYFMILTDWFDQIKTFEVSVEMIHDVPRGLQESLECFTKMVSVDSEQDRHAVRSDKGNVV